MVKNCRSLSATSVLIFALCTGSALAQRAQNYVASTGSDNNACTQTAPCRTFAGALAKTAASGQINVMDSSEYGSVIITQPVHIVANGVTATVTANPNLNTDAIVVNVPNGNVTLKGLTLAGSGNDIGVFVENATDLELENCDIDGYKYGVFVSSKAATRVHIYKSRIYQNTIGVFLQAGGFVNGVVIDDSTLDDNTQANISIDGANGAVLVGDSSIQGGPALTVVGGQPTVQSYGDNRMSQPFQATIVQRQ